jgi:uncharacterized protein YprB with RNaseH-like and TPR domain/predicted nuclease with RNAse H fold/dephospho-CoA kinase
MTEYYVISFLPALVPMLIHTFQHLRGITSKRELDFWRRGITSWDEFDRLHGEQLLLFPNHKVDISDSPLTPSRIALANGDTEFFASDLARNEHYRVAASFPEKTLFLDIETTGLSRHYDKITVIGWSMGKEFDVFIQGGSDEAFRHAMSQAKVIVTFNGSLFDLKFIAQEFPDIELPRCHVDLRFLAKRVGLTGGQKANEEEIGFKRPHNLKDMSGEGAPVLWYKYRWGDKKALKKLIQYNHADVEGMKTIFDVAVKRLLQKHKAPTSVIRALHRFAKDKSKITWADKSKDGSGIQTLPYKGIAGPLIQLKDLKVFDKSHDFRVVGIDLTGSEERPSGWCLLNNNYAETKSLGSDDDLVQTTLDSRPHVVSIDSPLSIPHGRTTVFDDDPHRDEFGIMRICERILKRRGVNVYPSLIPSMQRLTARGMRLANHFRSLGVPVIESYPGAAQDIMGIPRKQASLEYLSRGLQLFGIDGDFDHNNVTHDELDAITSAAVGLFFWSGKFEGLGTEEEEYLIIPDLHVKTSNWRKRKVIGISGPIATGKTTAANYLKSLNYSYGRFSQVLNIMLVERDIEVNRTSLQEIGEEINKSPGQRWLCKQLIKSLPEKGNLVIDGLRHPEDHAFMVETFGPAFVHVHIDSPTEIRAKRYIVDGNTENEFKTACSHNVEMEIGKLTELAHVVINNDGNVSSLHKEIEALVS